jgi:hypothetical protein
MPRTEQDPNVSPDEWRIVAEHRRIALLLPVDTRRALVAFAVRDKAGMRRILEDPKLISRAYAKTFRRFQSIVLRDTGSNFVAASDTRAPKTIASPPAGHLLRIIETIYSRKSVERVFRPIVTDLRNEYFEALASGAPRLKLFFIRLRGYAALARAGLPHFVLGLIDRLAGELGSRRRKSG